MHQILLGTLNHWLLAPDASPKVDLSIESMRSQRFGIGVFFFLMVGILVFSGIVYAVMRGAHAQKVTRTGEKIMFGAIIGGIVVAVIFAATQMVTGFLF